MSLLSKYLSSRECRLKAVELRNAAMLSSAKAQGFREAATVWDMIADELAAEEASLKADVPSQ